MRCTSERGGSSRDTNQRAFLSYFTVLSAFDRHRGFHRLARIVFFIFMTYRRVVETPPSTRKRDKAGREREKSDFYPATHGAHAWGGFINFNKHH